ncbi:DUF1844 domain-containing protein [Desulfurivibrio dismutans]|uniref:DUF1844 domain-containing protein n=1 Tax=Desulfurivibrio dismutans TaxID=1398908 RepID=UPI0023DC186A|nr:DUF1844 domain-containing protein [Desulfurivibrio alkaliphilus]MDF1615301.1 DUF1844 domain-containing protein [Desulfurivibrio alkaliphilus]
MAEDNGKREKCCPPGQVLRDGKCVLPEVTFTTLVLSLNTSALLHLGELEDPEIGGKSRDLALAKHTIDTLRLLEEKTAGNLTTQEKELLTNMLYDLRMRYVQLTR